MMKGESVSVAVRGARGRLLPFWRNYVVISDNTIVKVVSDLGMAVGAGWRWTRKLSFLFTYYSFQINWEFYFRRTNR